MVLFLRVLSLFSGIGGFEIACEWAGMEIVGQVEIEPFCQKVLAKHWPHVKRMGDIKQVRGDEFGAVDIIIGGVPCQPASVAGKRRGTEDDRWLWPEALRIVRTVRPRWCVFENPPGILSLQGGVPFDDILSEMEREGYEVGAYSIPACSVGAPHKRERIFIVAFSASVQCRAGSEVERVLRTVPENGQEYDYPDRPGKTRDAYVADTQNPDRRRADGEENSGRGDTEAGGCNIEGDRQKHGAVESRLGGVLNGFSAGMDGTKWPAGWWQTPSVEDAGRTGSEEAWMEYEKDGRTTQCRLRNQIWAHWPAGPGEQYPWEPPRIAKGVKDRVARLKALGNAVVPAQVYPILKAISEIERRLSE